MRVTDEMVRAALGQWYGLDNDKGPHEEKWQHRHMRAALEAALSHAAGQEVDSLPYAVSRSLYWLTQAMAGGPVKTSTVQIAWQHAENIRAYLASTPAVARSEGEDTKRLDWMEANCPNAPGIGGRWWLRVHDMFGKTFREAIDAKRLASSGMGGGES